MVPWTEGQEFTTYVNQGDRWAYVLAIVGDEVLIEYEMPGGATALRIYNYHWAVTSWRRVAYRKVPKRFLLRICETGHNWTGTLQQNGGKRIAIEEVLGDA